LQIIKYAFVNTADTNSGHGKGVAYRQNRLRTRICDRRMAGQYPAVGLYPTTLRLGMLGQADFLLRQLLDTSRTRPAHTDVGLAPAPLLRGAIRSWHCSHNDRAKWLKQQSYLLSEFLDEYCNELDLPPIGDGKQHTPNPLIRACPT
jgi:hypothetical protein